MNCPSFKTNRQILGIVLIIVAVAMLIYDFFRPPVGELSNFTLIVFAKLIAIAGSLLNLKININQPKSLSKDEEI